MLFCVYSILKSISEICIRELTKIQSQSSETKISLPTELCGYSVTVSYEPKKVIIVNTDVDNHWANVVIDSNSDVLSYILFNSKGDPFECGSFSLSNAPEDSEMIDMTSEDYEYTFQLSNCSQLTSLPLCTMILDVNGSTKEMNSLESLDFHFYPALREIVIRNSSFKNVKKLFFTSLSFLESIIIGKNCFTTTENEISMTADRVVHISGCSALESITVEDYSLSECCDLQIKCNPSLKTINFGSFSFFNCPDFILDGNLISLFSYQDLPSLQTISLGEFSFFNVHTIQLSSIFFEMDELKMILPSNC